MHTFPLPGWPGVCKPSREELAGKREKGAWGRMGATVATELGNSFAIRRRRPGERLRGRGQRMRRSRAEREEDESISRARQGNISVETEEMATKEPKFPKRYGIVGLSFMAFLLCNMDRVNLSIAILPMSEQFGWGEAQQGIIQSSFFWGYLLTQVAGGIWADRFGGKRVLALGVLWWSLATCLTPPAASHSFPVLLMSRALMGIGEGVAMPAMNNILSKWVPKSERSRALSFVYSGMFLGSAVGLLTTPVIIDHWGWPSVFYLFGLMGLLWYLVWNAFASSDPENDPSASAYEVERITSDRYEEKPVYKEGIPWRRIFSSKAVWAIILSHFANNWGTFILLAWLPKYYNDAFGVNLQETGFLAVLPWLTMAVSANLAGWIADTQLIGRGVSITLTRKIMQSIGFLGPAFCLSVLPNISSPGLAVSFLALSQACNAFSHSGLYSNHQDIGPRFAGILLGLSNTAGVLAGVVGTAATGFILERGSWDDVWVIASVLYAIGTAIWLRWSTGSIVIE